MNPLLEILETLPKEKVLLCSEVLEKIRSIVQKHIEVEATEDLIADLLKYMHDNELITLDFISETVPVISRKYYGN